MAKQKPDDKKTKHLVMFGYLSTFAWEMKSHKQMLHTNQQRGQAKKNWLSVYTQTVKRNFPKMYLLEVVFPQAPVLVI